MRKLKIKQRAFALKIDEKYGDNGDNIFPKPMADSEFRKYITDYFLGEDWYTINPVPQQQANVEIILRIIELYKPLR